MRWPPGDCQLKMDAETLDGLDNEQQFWDGMEFERMVTKMKLWVRTDVRTGIDSAVTKPSDTYELIDDALRSYLEFTAGHKSG